MIFPMIIPQTIFPFKHQLLSLPFVTSPHNILTQWLQNPFLLFTCLTLILILATTLEILWQSLHSNSLSITNQTNQSTYTTYQLHSMILANKKCYFVKILLGIHYFGLVRHTYSTFNTAYLSYGMNYHFLIQKSIPLVPNSKY